MVEMEPVKYSFAKEEMEGDDKSYEEAVDIQ
jgi:hypothetical protein